MIYPSLMAAAIESNYKFELILFQSETSNFFPSFMLQNSLPLVQKSLDGIILKDTCADPQRDPHSLIMQVSCYFCPTLILIPMLRISQCQVQLVKSNYIQHKVVFLNSLIVQYILHIMLAIGQYFKHQIRRLQEYGSSNYLFINARKNSEPSFCNTFYEGYVTITFENALHFTAVVITQYNLLREHIISSVCQCYYVWSIGLWGPRPDHDHGPQNTSTHIRLFSYHSVFWCRWLVFSQVSSFYLKKE